jgi:polyisoprenoid-binding protein YceI
MKIKFGLLSLIGAVMLLTGLSVPVSAADTYVLDVKGAHYYAGFQVSHLGFSTMHGRFDKMDGTIEFDADNIAASKVNITIDAASINTNHAKRNEHLKSPDFFNVAEFPTITFVSTKMELTDEKSGIVTGELTMLGVTKTITLDAKIMNVGLNPFSKAPTAAWSARGVIKRSDFGMKYGLPAIGDEITLLLDIEALKK